MLNLQYEPLNESHINDLVPIWSDEDVIRYTNIKKPCSLEEISERINRLKVFDVFIVRSNNDVVGIIGCPCIDKLKSQYGLFYQFKKSAWGQGFASQSTEWLLKYMRKKYSKVTLYADVVVDNIASEKILIYSGFVYINEEKNGFERDGRKITIRNYKLKGEHFCEH